MKQLFKISFLWVLLAAIFMSSCETSEVTNINFDKATISLKVGQSDSISSTIAYSGEISDIPHEWIVENPDIISITEKDPATSNGATSGTSLEKVVVIKALKAGSSKVTLSIDGKKLSCQVTVDQRVFTFNRAQASNWGDFYDTGTNNFDMYLMENTLSFNSEGEIQGDGNLIYLDFYLPLTQNTLSSGDFTLANTGEINTFYPGELVESEGQNYTFGTRLINIEGNTSTISFINDGSFTIVKNGTMFAVAGEFTLGNDEVIQFSYIGMVEELDKREEPVEINPNMTKGLLVYYGDAYQTGTTNNFNLYLGPETVVFEDSVWNGDILVLEFNTDLTATNSIPAGTYNMMGEQISPFSLVYGYTTEGGDNWGTWYYGESTKKIKTGNMVVSSTGDIYTIQYELYDRFGSKIWGTYTGTPQYINATQSSSGVAPSYVKGNKTKNTQLTKKVLIKNDRLKSRKPVKF
ncbi:MAG: hypothetical protein VB066_11965 [Paludibacter sp.]|nr:hypothetical protein [Paludibacter sp.]